MSPTSGFGSSFEHALDLIGKSCREAFCHMITLRHEKIRPTSIRLHPRRLRWHRHQRRTPDF